MGFCKTTQTSGLYNCQQEKLIACLYEPVKQRKTKNKNPLASLYGNREDKRDQFASASY